MKKIYIPMPIKMPVNSWIRNLGNEICGFVIIIISNVNSVSLGFSFVQKMFYFKSWSRKYGRLPLLCLQAAYLFLSLSLANVQTQHYNEISQPSSVPPKVPIIDDGQMEYHLVKWFIIEGIFNDTPYFIHS